LAVGWKAIRYKIDDRTPSEVDKKMRDQTLMMPGAEPYFARGGATGVLILHGFTASPYEVKWLGQHLAAQGYTVYAPRIAGHGTDYRDLARTKWQDWAASALDGYHVLRAQCDRVFIGGLSVGGTLALLVASQVEVNGVIALAAPVLPFRGLSVERLRIAKRLRPFTDQTDRSPFAEYILLLQKQLGEPVVGRVRYGRWSTAALEQVMRLIPQVQARLGHITVPVLAVYSKADATVLMPNLDALKAGLTQAARVEAHILERSSHILTQDMERETVFRLVGDFVGV
jgi:carboxylesterase